MYRRTSTCALALIAGFGASAAIADVNARQVWDDWKSSMTSVGYQVTGTEARSGDTLSVSDITMTMAIPEAEGRIEIGMPGLDFVDNGDGTVAIRMPRSFPIHFDVTFADAEGGSGTVTYSHSGQTITVSGDASAMTYDYSIAQAGFAITELMIEDQDAADLVGLNVTMNGTQGSHTIKAGSLREYDQRFHVDSVEYDLSFQDPVTSESGLFKGSYSDVNFAGTGAVPERMVSTNPAAMIEAGLSVDGGMTHGGSSSEFSVIDGNAATSGTTSAESGTFNVRMNADGITYDIAANNTTLNMVGGDLPLPVDVRFGTLGLRFTLPLAKSETSQDFAMALTLGDFQMNDMLWNIFDPTAVLPRDPATIAFDLSGQLRMLVDIFDPEATAQAQVNGAQPAELETLNISDITVRVAGADLNGSGAFTFDNTDTQTFNGVPRPAGALNLDLKGGNGLIDRLIQLGFLPEEQAMGARMMLGLFAVPVGDDHLQSTIEINDQGHVLANGQRLQ